MSCQTCAKLSSPNDDLYWGGPSLLVGELQSAATDFGLESYYALHRCKFCDNVWRSGFERSSESYSFYLIPKEVRFACAIDASASSILDQLKYDETEVFNFVVDILRVRIRKSNETELSEYWQGLVKFINKNRNLEQVKFETLLNLLGSVVSRVESLFSQANTKSKKSYEAVTIKINIPKIHPNIIEEATLADNSQSLHHYFSQLKNLLERYQEESSPKHLQASFSARLEKEKSSLLVRVVLGLLVIFVSELAFFVALIFIVDMASAMGAVFASIILGGVWASIQSVWFKVQVITQTLAIFLAFVLTWLPLYFAHTVVYREVLNDFANNSNKGESAFIDYVEKASGRQIESSFYAYLLLRANEGAQVRGVRQYAQVKYQRQGIFMWFGWALQVFLLPFLSVGIFLISANKKASGPR